MLTALLILAVFIALQLAIGFLMSAPVYRGPVSDHFDGRRFFTPGGRPAKGFYDVFRWMIARKQGPWTLHKEAAATEAPPIKVTSGVRITFVNHSTFLIQTEGLNILTDPVWSERVSPVAWAGPKRMRPPGISLQDLPPIDVVLLSHNHYDHLDIRTLEKINHVHKPKIVTALGVGLFLSKRKLTGCSELDWWDEIPLNATLRVQAVPAQHFSARGVFDRDGTLWCGFVLKRNAGQIYFAGDSGYHATLFREIGARCPTIQVGIIPIGAYKPEWFMSPIHCSPGEAVSVHQDVKATQSIASHFGTFPLADDGEAEPAQDLTRALSAAGLSEDSFLLLREGEGRTFP